MLLLTSCNHGTRVQCLLHSQKDPVAFPVGKMREVKTTNTEFCKNVTNCFLLNSYVQDRQEQGRQKPIPDKSGQTHWGKYEKTNPT